MIKYLIHILLISFVITYYAISFAQIREVTKEYYDGCNTITYECIESDVVVDGVDYIQQTCFGGISTLKACYPSELIKK